MHIDGEAHETPPKELSLGKTSCCRVHVLAPPAGLVEIITLEPPTAMQKDADVQVKLGNSPAPIGVTVQAVELPVGSVDVNRLPASSSPTQSDSVGQESARMGLLPSTWTAFQAPAPPVGSVEIRSSP